MPDLETDRGDSPTRVPVMSAVKFPAPPRFEGALLASPSAVIGWLETMTDHLARMALVSSPWSEEIALALAISFMGDVARKIAKRCQSELEADANWKVVALELHTLLAPKSSPFDILDRLTKCRQGELTLAQYITVFNNCLEEAIDVGFSDCISACKWFVDGMEFDLKVAVMDTMSSQMEDPWVALQKKKVTQAIRDLAKLAMRRLDVVELKRSRARAAQLRAAVVQPSVQALPASRPQPRTPLSDEDRKLRHEAFAKTCATRYGVPVEVVRERIRRLVCVKCGDSSHHVQACTSSAPAQMSPASGQSQTNAKAH